MQISVSGRHVDTSEAFRAHADDGFRGLAAQHHIDPIDVSVVMEKQNHFFSCDVRMHLTKGTTLRAEGHGADGYNAFDNALTLITTRLRRHKKRVRDYHKHRDSHADASDFAPHYVLNGAHHDDEADDLSPAIIAEIRSEIPTLSVGDAVMHLDFGAEPVFAFRNSKGGHVNFLYRRGDGNIGWIDPGATITPPAA